MWNRERVLETIQTTGIVAIIRLERADELVRVAEALHEGGVRTVEFTLTTPGALDALRETARRLGDAVLLGAGTVLDPESGRAAIFAGAQFIVAPTLNRATVALCRRSGVAVIPGALTPTEILTAWEVGADLVKVFPATTFGPGYLRDVLAPLPQVRLVPTGGVSLANAAEFIRAGAVALGVGSQLVDRRAVAAGRFDEITERARRFVEAVRSARAG
ncbi:MAG: bifunctional 4-hydroxy-2-oxoglutarate aldolase/2-dehydro-3-deoxy-phosphogluconate aldolase [Chloroflexi bacterium]|nr:bifunctional 4-hydroxy-2-oxoglutarate aldolase/2-dehydro-3-deoxy-phosphogluconate aldolase [Chloroflexota bacterium]